MKRNLLCWLSLSLFLSGTLFGCGWGTDGEGQISSTEEYNTEDQEKEETTTEHESSENKIRIYPTEKITELEPGLSVVGYEGDYGFAPFLEQGGAASDAEVMEYLVSRLSSELPDLLFEGNPFGCSTLSVQNRDGGYLFGRNFDWNACQGLIVSARPENGYASVSTVNMDFIHAGRLDTSKLPDDLQAMIALYAPLDGMNEKGLSVAVNMIQDPAVIEQDTGKPDLTTTTAVRLLLDRAADVEEAIDLLGRYDLHGSMGMMVHLALADGEGRSVVVEYIDNEMVVTETPAVTNFYLAPGEKYGIGTAQSHTRDRKSTRLNSSHM